MLKKITLLLEHVKFQSSKDTPQNISDNIENSSHTVISLNDNHQPDRPSTQSTTTTEIDHNANGNALGFKIKEITEKKEIRITDQNQQSNGHKVNFSKHFYLTAIFKFLFSFQF